MGQKTYVLYIEYAVNKPYVKIATIVKNVHTSNSSASWGKMERASLSRARRPGIYLEAASHIPPLCQSYPAN